MIAHHHAGVVVVLMGVASSHLGAFLPTPHVVLVTVQ